MNCFLRIIFAAVLLCSALQAAAEGPAMRSLFNGKDLSGWSGGGCMVEDGAITSTPGGRNLMTQEAFSNYLLEFDFKLTPGSDSGLGIHYPGAGNGASHGMELRILSNATPTDKGLGDYQFHRGLFSMTPAKYGVLKPVGQWNRQKVTIKGSSLRVELNGAPILGVDLDFLSKKHPQHAGLKRRSGHIGLLGHGGKVSFRNIRVMELATGPVDPETKSSVPLRVACVGDSITQGDGLDAKDAYPSQLQTLLGDGWKIGNFGVSGRTLLKKGDFPYWSEKAYQDALGFEPDVAIIMLGTNDTKQHNWKFEAEFVADYTALVKSFQNLASRPKVYLCRPCPVPEPGNYGINEVNLEEGIQHIEALAKALDLDVIDMHKALADKPELLPDKVHPNKEGAGELAREAYATLTGKTTSK